MLSEIDATSLPRHIAISADGNGRWAEQRGLPRTAGHKASENSFKEVLLGVAELNIPFLSLHVFSTENWKRAEAETSAIFELFIDVLQRNMHLFNQIGLRFRWAGIRGDLPPALEDALVDIESKTQENSSVTLQFCANYGGRAELAHAAAALAKDVLSGLVDAENIDERTVAGYLDEPEIPDVDLYIRTAGERRISNFLLWQSAYAEICFVDTLWPDFDRRELGRVIRLFASRERKFGAVKKD